MTSISTPVASHKLKGGLGTPGGETSDYIQATALENISSGNIDGIKNFMTQENPYFSPVSSSDSLFCYGSDTVSPLGEDIPIQPLSRVHSEDICAPSCQVPPERQKKTQIKAALGGLGKTRNKSFIRRDKECCPRVYDYPERQSSPSLARSLAFNITELTVEMLAEPPAHVYKDKDNLPSLHKLTESSEASSTPEPLEMWILTADEVELLKDMIQARKNDQYKYHRDYPLDTERIGGHFYCITSEEVDIARETDARLQANSREKKVVLWKYRDWKEKHDDCKTRQRQLRNCVKFIIEEAKLGADREGWAKGPEWWISASKELKGAMEEKREKESEKKPSPHEIAEELSFKLHASSRTLPMASTSSKTNRSVQTNRLSRKLGSNNFGRNQLEEVDRDLSIKEEEGGPKRIGNFCRRYQAKEAALKVFREYLLAYIVR